MVPFKKKFIMHAWACIVKRGKNGVVNKCQMTCQTACQMTWRG